MEDMIYFEENGGSFASRHHVINHVDMILGLSKSEKELETQDKLIVIFDHEEKQYITIKSSELTSEEMIRLRKRILIDSIYAERWEQLFFVNNNKDDYIRSNELKNDDEIEKILFDAFVVWEDNEGGWTEFVDRTSAVVVLLNWDVPVVDRIIVKKAPDRVDVDSIPVAVNNRRILENTYTNDVSWKVYSETICKNDFVKSYLQKVQNNLCSVCKKEIDDSAVIHHVDYDHKCAFCNSGLEWRIPRKRVQPNCEQCFHDHREWFEQCVSRLKLVHSNCNYIIDHLV